MRSVCLAAMLSVRLAVWSQNVTSPLLYSHDRVDGPFAGEYHVEDLQVFADGKVVYVEEGTHTMGGKPERSVFEGTIGPDKIHRLVGLLDSREIRSLPKKLSSMTHPIDFFWQKSLEIRRLDKTQKIQIENFYPFLNEHEPAYPKALIELECSLQHIKAEAARRTQAKNEDDWCRAILAKSEPAKSACEDDGAQPRIVAGEGWGPVRIGAALQAVNAFLGQGLPGPKYSDVYFRDYAPKGVQVSFENSSNSVHAVFFYNGQFDSEEIGVFCGGTASGINWQSSVDDVKKAYGQPTAEYSYTHLGVAWQRLVFPGIDFRFEDGKMVRIGIPGN